MANPVLVVHRDPSLRRFLRLKLEEVGTPVLETATCGQAVELLAGGAHPVAVVICGARSGDLTPTAFVQAVRRADPQTRIFFFTSRTPSLDGSLLDGIQIFPKPGGLSDLIAASRTAAGERPEVGCGNENGPGNAPEAGRSIRP